jgi:signal transduction histidine kinase/ActR/RegA family two-component response regulator
MGGHEPDLVGFQGSELARALFHEAADALLLVDSASEQVIEVNRLAGRLVNLPREAILQQPIQSFLRHEPAESAWLEAFRALRPFHGSEGFLLRTSRPEEWLPVSLTITPLPTPGDSLVLFTLRDRSEQLEALRRFQRTEAELRRVLATVSECLWSCRADRHGGWGYLYLSPVVQRITGRSVGFFLEDPAAWEKIIEPEDLPRWTAFREQLRGGVSAEVEFRLRRADGTLIWVRDRAVAGAGNGSGFILLSGVLADVSDRKLAEQTLAQSDRLGSERLTDLGLLAGRVARDFNQLLTGILGAATLGRMGGSADPGILLSFEQIEELALQGADLCKQLGLCAGRDLAAVAPHDLNVLVRQTIEARRSALPAKTRLELELAEHLPPVVIDAAQVRQALAHVLANAFEALNGLGGQVIVQTRNLVLASRLLAQGTEALVIDFAPGEYVTVEVRDTGPGMSAEVLARLCTPFFTTRPAHRGLGLATVLGVVRGHKGAIRIESAPGRGTAVQILLPSSSERLTARFPPAPAWKGHGAVLVVDDQASVRDVAGRLLQSVGFQPVLAHDGDEALEHIQRQEGPLRLVLLDLTVPSVGGQNAFEQIRERLPGIPILLMSGYPASEVLSRFNQQSQGPGSVGYLQKPFRLPSMIDAVRRCLGE